jgi:hypothetical protein
MSAECYFALGQYQSYWVGEMQNLLTRISSTWSTVSMFAVCPRRVILVCLFVNHFSNSSGEDQHAFRGSFDQSLRLRAEMLSYVRFKCQPEYAVPAKEVLFEVKGYPHYIDDEQYARCFFAVAKPYPSRNTAM